VVIVTGFEREVLEDQARILARKHGLAVAFVHNAAYETTNVLASWMLAAPSFRRPYVYLHGDTIFEPTLLERLCSVSTHSGVTITYDRHQCEAEEMKVTLRGERVMTISKTMDPATAHGEFTGVLACSAEAHATLSVIAAEILTDGSEATAFFEAALQRGISEGALECGALDISGLLWREIDFAEDLLSARKMFARASCDPSDP
jgi:choline kinase